MSIEPIAPDFKMPLPEQDNPGFADIARKFQAVLVEESNQGLGQDLAPADPITMPHPLEDEGEVDPIIQPRLAPLAQIPEGGGALQPLVGATADGADLGLKPLSAIMAMLGGEDFTYNRETLMSEVDTFLSALGVDHHDILEFTEAFPPEGAELELDRMGALVTKAGDILAGRVDAGKLAQLLPDSGMSEAQVQSWLTALGVEYQRTGELMKADGEAGKAFESSLWEENLVANLVKTLPGEVSLSDLSGLLANTVGESALYDAFGGLFGDLV